MENKNLNLVEILKNCPKGTKLYSTIYGEVEFDRTVDSLLYPIIYKFYHDCGKEGMDSVTVDGKYATSVNGECTLFPSKEQRDWSKFKVEIEMVDGEIYYCRLFNNHNAIYIHRTTTRYKTEYYVKLDLCDLGLLETGIITTNEENIKELRKATEEEKRLFFEIIEKNGRKWDADKKELVRIEKKFDVLTLQPFDKVLIRDNDAQSWRCDFYNSYVKDAVFPFMTVRGIYKQCVPYNNNTKHLVGSNELPSEKYITWGK